jgi:c-di-GMP-binding flagellar brake protein YcgR
MAPLSEMEMDILRMACESNENITIMGFDSESVSVYKSRLLHIDLPGKFMVIDEASPDTPNAMPLARGEVVDVFFEFKNFRYIFATKIVDHTLFRLQNRGVYALKILMPSALRDGERREYFRVEVPKAPAVEVSFHIRKADAEFPLMSTVVEETPELFEARMDDISGGGFAMTGRSGIDLDKGDVIDANFLLRAGEPAIELWAEIRYRKNLPTGDVMWGAMFLAEERNPYLKSLRSRIMRFVIERQREMLFR